MFDKIKSFFQKQPDLPPYIDKIKDYDYVQIVRLKGDIDKEMIPVIEARIEYNRSQGETSKKNIVVDYTKVTKVDSATVAFHLVRLKELQEAGYKVGFINVKQELRTYIDMFKQDYTFRIYDTEKAAVKELNQLTQ